MRRIFYFLVCFFAYNLSYASPIVIFCTHPSYPKQAYPQLHLTIDQPVLNDSCDISYNHDCGKTGIDYVLTADLSAPNNQKQSELDKFMDLIYADVSADIEISTPHFNFQLPQWRILLNQDSIETGSLESFVAEAPSITSLSCKKF